MENEAAYPKIYLYRRIVQAKLHIDQNYHKPLQLEDIAGEAHYSKFHFIKQFKKAYGYTPYQYLKKVRLDQALDFLDRGQSVTEVCYAVGFESLGSFSSLFKKKTGKTPSQYLNERRLRQKEIDQKPLAYIPGCHASSRGWKD